MDQRNNQPGGAPSETGSLRPPMGYPPLNPTGQPGQTGYQPPYAPQPGQTGYQPPYGAQPGQTGYQPPYGPQPGQTGYQPPYATQPGQTGYQPSYGPQPGQTGYQPPYGPDMTGYPPQEQPPACDGFAPPTGFLRPDGPIRPPKRAPKWLRPLLILLAVAAVGAGVWILLTFLLPEGETYAVVEAGYLDARYAGDCVIVRDEVPYDAEGVTKVDYEADEGASVLYGTTICEVYSSGYSTREMTTLQSYRDSIRDYQKSLLDADTTYDARMTRVQNDVVTRVREVRDLVSGAPGSLSNQERLLETAFEARQNYLRSKYGDDQRLSRLYDDETSQLQRIESWTKRYVANGEGIVSFYSDGYEYGLNSQNYMTFSPEEVRAMFGGERPVSADDLKGKTTLYRLVRNTGWHVLFLARETDWDPVQGQRYELKLSSFLGTQTVATVEDFVRSGRELLLRLTVDSSVAPVLSLRTCQAELRESVLTLRVPEKAIVRQNEMEGVWAVSGGEETFVPVTVVWRSEGSVYVRSVQQGLLYEGQTVRVR